MWVPSFSRIAALRTPVACIPLVARQDTGYLKTKVNPGRAGVFIDGKYVGPAGNFGVGRKYAAAGGEHEVRLSEPRCEDLVAKVTIQPGKRCLVLNPGHCTVKVIPVGRAEGRQEHVKIEADKVAIVRSQK